MSSKPIIGLAGGIGSGKSMVARLMSQFGGYVIDADAIAHWVLQTPEVCRELVGWLGPGVLDADGRVSRRELARRVFDDPESRRRLEGIVHPLVRAEREARLAAALPDPKVRFIVQDVPLLFEVGMDKECDRTVFVEADREARLRRLAETRGWDRAELDRREKNQWPLDKKRSKADAIIVNDGDEAQCLAQVRSLLDRILSNNAIG